MSMTKGWFGGVLLLAFVGWWLWIIGKEGARDVAMEIVRNLFAHQAIGYWMGGIAMLGLFFYHLVSRDSIHKLTVIIGELQAQILELKSTKPNP